MSDDYSAKRISDTLCELRSIGDTVAYQLGDDNTESRAARIIEQLQRKLESAESRLGRLQDWIQERADEDCEYGEPDFEACGHNRKHGICEACSAKRVLAQDHFVSDAPVVERPAQ